MTCMWFFTLEIPVIPSMPSGFSTLLLNPKSKSQFRLGEIWQTSIPKCNGLVDPIGNTLLIHINSLSEATGCEVCNKSIDFSIFLCFYHLGFLWFSLVFIFWFFFLLYWSHLLVFFDSFLKKHREEHSFLTYKCISGLHRIPANFFHLDSLCVPCQWKSISKWWDSIGFLFYESASNSKFPLCKA